jgi:hypothetical protein
VLNFQQQSLNVKGQFGDINHAPTGIYDGSFHRILRIEPIGRNWRNDRCSPLNIDLLG